MRSLRNQANLLGRRPVIDKSSSSNNATPTNNNTAGPNNSSVTPIEQEILRTTIPDDKQNHIVNGNDDEESTTGDEKYLLKYHRRGVSSSSSRVAGCSSSVAGNTTPNLEERKRFVLGGLDEDEDEENDHGDSNRINVNDNETTPKLDQIAPNSPTTPILPNQNALFMNKATTTPPSSSTPTSFQISYKPDEQSVSLMKNLFVEKIIGHGASAQVFSVSGKTTAKVGTDDDDETKHHHHHDERSTDYDYAVKVIPRRIFDQKQTEMIKREFECLKALQDHPLVVRLFSFIQEQDRVLFLFEKCKMNLRSVLQKIEHRRFEHEDIRKRIIYEVLSVLQLMHFRGIAYRDIKPENILVRDDGRLCLCDFGLAKKVMTVDSISTENADGDDTSDKEKNKSDQDDNGNEENLRELINKTSSSILVSSKLQNPSTPLQKSNITTNNNNNHRGSISSSTTSSSQGGGVHTGVAATATSPSQCNNNLFLAPATTTPTARLGSRTTSFQSSSKQQQQQNQPNPTPPQTPVNNNNNNNINNSKREFVGTCSYIAPDLINPLHLRHNNTQRNSSKNNNNNNKNSALSSSDLFGHDMWALGILHYELCFSRPPFQGNSYSRNEEDTLAIIVNAQMNNEKIPMPEWPPLSAHEKDFMLRLLKYDPRQRMTATEALFDHPWMKEFCNQATSSFGSRPALEDYRKFFVGATTTSSSSPSVTKESSEEVNDTNNNNSSSTAEVITKKSLFETLASKTVGGDEKSSESSSLTDQHSRQLPPPWFAPSSLQQECGERDTTTTSTIVMNDKEEQCSETDDKIRVLIELAMKNIVRKEAEVNHGAALVAKPLSFEKDKVNVSSSDSISKIADTSAKAKRQRLAAAGAAIGAVSVASSSSHQHQQVVKTSETVEGESKRGGGSVSGVRRWFGSFF